MRKTYLLTYTIIYITLFMSRGCLKVLDTVEQNWVGRGKLIKNDRS